MLLDDMPGWEARMARELTHKRYAAGAHIRIHDSGDFYSDDYVDAWLRIIRATPHVTFYAYTKSVDRFRRRVEPDPPANFLWVYSLGGKEDHLIDLEHDRHADVFTDDAAMAAAGYSSQEESDLLAVYGPPKVGIPANNIRHLRKRQGEETFGSIQRETDERARARRRRGPGKQYEAGRP
jgi:hypothetical protein